MQRRKRKEFSSQADYAKHRDAYAAFLIGNRTPVGEVRIVEKRVEVPVDRIVEKIVFRDPPEQSTLRKVGEGLEGVQAKLEARVKPDAVPVELQEHVQEGETVSEAKSRFLKLYSDLGNKVQMGIAKDFERRLHESLHAKMNWITGD